MIGKKKEENDGNLRKLKGGERENVYNVFISRIV
jgi:hypothetical protein